MLEKLFLAGADVFRINMSHTKHDLLRQLHADIREGPVRAHVPLLFSYRIHTSRRTTA